MSLHYLLKVTIPATDVQMPSVGDPLYAVCTAAVTVAPNSGELRGMRALEDALQGR